MRILYTPAEGEKREFSFVPRKLMSPEAEALEDCGGNSWDSFDEFAQKFMKGNRRAYRAALWILLRREALAKNEKAPRFADLSIGVDEIEVEFDDAEKLKIREAIDAEPDMDPDQREQLLAVLDADVIANLNAALPKDPPGNDLPDKRTATEPGDIDIDSL